MRVLWVFFVLLSACASTPPAQDAAPALKPGIYDVATGLTLDEATLVERVRSAKYVAVGESHDSAEDHALQLRLYQKASEGRRVALGMEMFQRPYQEPLDLYVRGEIDEAQMLEQTEWASRWGFETGLYQPLWRHAQSLGLAVVALNTRRELTKRVSAVGVDGLNEDERAELVDLDLSREDYRTWLRDIFAGHGMATDETKLDRFYQAQVLWDETMADSAVGFMAAHTEYDGIFLVVGRGHVERRWGIPSRIERRDPEHRVLVIVRPDGNTTLETAQDLALADILVVE